MAPPATIKNRAAEHDLPDGEPGAEEPAHCDQYEDEAKHRKRKLVGEEF